MPSAASFNPNAGLALRLPRCPAPRCEKCNADLLDVRPFRTEHPNGSTTIVECLAKCRRCGTKHVGKRRLQSTPQGSRYVGQSFSLWTDDHEKTLKPVAVVLAAAATPRAANPSPKSVQIIPIKVPPRKASTAKRRRRALWLGAAASAASVLAFGAYVYLG